MAPTIPIDFTGQKQSRKCSAPHMMGKSRKVSKGYSTGFIPGSRHAVETVGESEGLQSSGRVNMEIASEDSHARKRKCTSLDMDRNDNFGIPVQAWSLSKMSKSERKELEMRLKWELERVRASQMKMGVLSSSLDALSPSSDIRSCSDGQKKLPVESLQSSSAMTAIQGKKQTSSRLDGSQMRRGNVGQLESAKSAVAPASISSASWMKQCETLLNRLMSHQFGWVFNSPVDVVKLNIPDYFTVIKHPMDLGTVKSMLTSGQYSSPLGFAADVRLTFKNAMTYNPPGNDVHIMAETLSKHFEMRWKSLEKKFRAVEPTRPAVIETENVKHMLPVKKEKTASLENKLKLESVRRIMPDVEKHKLSTELEALLEELPENIVEFLKGQSCNAGQINEDEIEIDIDALSDDSLFKLRKLLDEYLLKKQQSQLKAKPSEMKFVKESGFSNSSMQPDKGQYLIEEDVDIGGNDIRVSDNPPVQISKDAAHRSSSSSSQCSSSSSDSDSSSTSSSESEGAKASVPAGLVKQTQSPGEIKGKKRGDGSVTDNVNNRQIEKDSWTKQSYLGTDNQQEGESAPERQVSPGKLYRAALLKSRFADTILKAQEKTLEKGERRDPERLRIEREELERRRKEEKARLLAEAQVAEENRKKAEAEAVAEAKRRRELEREAARLALQKMEKTVDINENIQFLEDLEMLKAAPLEHMPTFVAETSPDQSGNGFGSFQLKVNNPLEQLGLYMKADEDEDEEAELPSAPDSQIKHVEDGEID